jgi:predicted nuclease with RNAse H fold
MRKAKITIAGLDLAAKPQRPTGIAIAECDHDCELRLVESKPLSDNEIVETLLQYDTRITVIDAPLSLPQKGGYRSVERKFISIGGRLLPLTIKSMRMLALRAMQLASTLRRLNIKVYETHPRSVLRICGVKSGVQLVERVSIKIYSKLDRLAKHAEDALIALAVGVCIHRGCAGFVTDIDGVIVYIPHYKCKE